MAELPQLPVPIQERLTRGRKQRDEEKGKREEAMAFWRGDQYKFYDAAKRVISSQPTSTSAFDQTSKPPWRQRRTRNLIFDIVEREVSAVTARIPGYEINPSTTDPQDIDAAKLSEKIAIYGYDKWAMRQVTETTVRNAIIADEGFAWPYFDNSVGPYIRDAGVGQGEISCRTFSANEVGWEPGLSFEDSPWLFIEQARDPQSIYETEGFIGGNLKPDAQGDSNLVIVCDYLERPSAKFPLGRWITVANEKVIIAGTDEAGMPSYYRPYPCVDPQGEVIDEPVLHRLTYARDPSKDRGVGLVRHLVDLQRVVNDMPNRQLEWVRLALNPQIIITNGGFAKGTRISDEPGAVYQAFGSGSVDFRPVPPIPGELEEIKQAAIADMGRIAAQNDIPQNVEAGRAIQALVEKDATRRAAFIANLAEFHSRLMRHCLYLVQKHYTEERVIRIRGDFGAENIDGFLGAQLRGQADVTVLPGSVESRTRESVQQTVLAYADRGWVAPQDAMRAIDSGTASILVESFERDIARADLLIQKVRDGSIGDMTSRSPFPGESTDALDESGAPIPLTDEMGAPVVDPMTGQPQYEQWTEIPGWMPRPFDNVGVQKDHFADWMKTSDYSMLDPMMQQAANLIYAGYLKVEADQAAQAQAAQVAQAEQLGMANATRPTDKSSPSMPGGDGGTGGGKQTGQLFGPRYQYGSTQTF